MQKIFEQYGKKAERAGDVYYLCDHVEPQEGATPDKVFNIAFALDRQGCAKVYKKQEVPQVESFFWDGGRVRNEGRERGNGEGWEWRRKSRGQFTTSTNSSPGSTKGGIVPSRAKEWCVRLRSDCGSESKLVCPVWSVRPFGLSVRR